MVLISVLLIIILVTLSSLRRYESLVASWLTINQRKMKSTPATWMRVKLRLRMMPTKQAENEFSDKHEDENGDEDKAKIKIRMRYEERYKDKDKVED